MQRQNWFALLIAGLGLATQASAQDGKAGAAGPAPRVEPVACSGCFKFVQPTLETVKHTRYCYACKVYDECPTCCARTPILTTLCPWCTKCKSCDCEDVSCIKCGKPYCRRVLIKKFVTEEVPRPRCVVESVPLTCPNKQ